MEKIAIFASGNGSNAENLIRHFNQTEGGVAEVSVVLTNNSKAGVIGRAERLGVPVVVFEKKQLIETDEVMKCLRRRGVTFIVLSGFLLRMPEEIVSSFEHRMVNIHPSLLPKFGGKGMYGHRVHEAVIAAGEKVTGITIHYVNSYLDDGEITLQKTVEVTADDTAESVEAKIHALEMEWFPREVERLICERRV